MVEHNELPAELKAMLSTGGDGPAARIDAAAAERIIEGALAGAAVAPARLPRVRKLGWPLAAAFVLTGSAAAMYAAQRAHEHVEAPELPVTTHAAPMQPQATPPAAQPPAAVVAPAQAPATVVAPVRPATEPRVPAHATGAADDLLQRANRLRGEGDYRGAERTYLHAAAISPNGPAAYAARVAAAGLRLERFNDARGALQLYGQALRDQPTGALSPEIHEGMAHAFRTLARGDDEHRALQALLAEQATGPAADRARARLQVLDARH